MRRFPFQISMMGATQTVSLLYMRERMADIMTMSDEMLVAINSMEQMLDLVQQLNDVTHDGSHDARDQSVTTQRAARSPLRDIDDFVRPLRSYFTGSTIASTFRCATGDAITV